MCFGINWDEKCKINLSIEISWRMPIFKTQKHKRITLTQILASWGGVPRSGQYPLVESDIGVEAWVSGNPMLVHVMLHSELYISLSFEVRIGRRVSGHTVKFRSNGFIRFLLCSFDIYSGLPRAFTFLCSSLFALCDSTALHVLWGVGTGLL